MTFEDVFYPKDQERRNEIAVIRDGVIQQFEQYSSVWKEYTRTIVPVLRYQRNIASTPYAMACPKELQKKIKNTRIGDCAKELYQEHNRHFAAKQVRIYRETLLNTLLPAECCFKGIPVNEREIPTRMRKAFCVFLGNLALDASAYFCQWYYQRAVVDSAMDQKITEFATYLSGSLGDFQFGEESIIVSDWLIKSINNAVVSGELEEPIDALKILYEKTSALQETAKNIEEMISCIKSCTYELNNNWILKKEGAGYVAVSEKKVIPVYPPK